jgi:hypothetical protein
MLRPSLKPHQYPYSYIHLQALVNKLDGSSKDAGPNTISPQLLPPPSSSLSSSSSSAPLSNDRVSQQLQRDALEQYLFMSEYMHQCGALWSPVIVAMYCYSFYLSFAIIYRFIATPLPTLLTADFIAGIATELFILVLFLVFPPVSVASANAAIAPVVHMFTNSGSCDFAMMGMYVCMYACM